MSEPDFKRAFDKMELYCDLLIFYGEYDMFDDRSHLEKFIFAVWRNIVSSGPPPIPAQVHGVSTGTVHMHEPCQ